jgi:hypothetical protein
MSKQGENGRIERFEKEWQIDNRELSESKQETKACSTL